MMPTGLFLIIYDTLFTHHNYTYLNARMPVPRAGSVGYLCIGSSCFSPGHKLHLLI